MLRWNPRALDRYGCIYTSEIRFSSTTGIGFIANHAAQTRLPSDDTSKDSKQVVTLTVGTQLNPTHPTRGFTRRNAPACEMASAHLRPHIPCGMNASNHDAKSSLVNAPRLVHISETKTLTSSSSSHTSSIPPLIPTMLPVTITSLTRLLSSGSTGEGFRSVDSLISFYHKAVEQAVLQHLNGRLFSELMSILGTISEFNTRDPHIFDSPLLPYFIPPTTASNLWSLILQVGQDKEKLGLGLLPSDQYWMMRAYLAQAERTGVAKSRSAMPEIISSARSHYERFKDSTDDPQVHILYLRALLFLNDSRSIHEAVLHLCDLLRRSANPHPQLVGIFWQLISARGSALAPRSRELLCNLAFHGTRSHTAAARSPVNVAPPRADAVRRDVLRMSDITSEFVAVLLLSSTSQYSSPFINHWAGEQVRHVLSPSLSLDTRWNNLTLLAMHLSSKGIPPEFLSTSMESLEPGSIPWRTALILDSVEKRLPREVLDRGPMHEVIEKITHPLWRTFADTAHEDRPIDITRAFVATFLRTAAKTDDGEIQAASYQLSQDLGLWKYCEGDARATKAQAIDSIVAYASAFVACHGQDWNQLYTIIQGAQPNPSWKTDVTNALLRHYASNNIDVAHRLYLHSKREGVDISSDALQAMFLSLATNERWTMIIPLLNDPSLSREHVEFLLAASLRVFQVRRYESADTNVVKHLARIAHGLYAEEHPPASLKYPLRYFFSMMIRTRNTPIAVKLITSIYKIAPEFFTFRLIRHLHIQLVRCREFASAVELYRELGGGGVVRNQHRALDGIRHKLTLKFLHSGAYKLARSLAGRSPTRISSITRREALIQAVGLRGFPSSSSIHLSVRLLVARARTHGPTFRHAISTLVKHRRLYAARALYAKVRPSLDPKTNVVIGNIVLHGSLLKPNLRNGRLVRHVLQTKDLLAKDYGFIPDRTTLNIILKALLRWKTMVDAGQVRRLFDQMVRDGYPVPDHWRRQHGVPFSSPPSGGSFSIPSLTAHISFSRHVRPMYKMFIKSFFLRNDRVAARTVVGILKEVQRDEMEEREKRNRARRQGIIKKQMKLTKGKCGP